jgi:hypothetical protein
LPEVKGIRASSVAAIIQAAITDLAKACLALLAPKHAFNDAADASSPLSEQITPTLR